jgi:hypothetical protein
MWYRRDEALSYLLQLIQITALKLGVDDPEFYMAEELLNEIQNKNVDIHSALVATITEYRKWHDRLTLVDGQGKDRDRFPSEYREIDAIQHRAGILRNALILKIRAHHS